MLRITSHIINWIKQYFKDNPQGKAVIGISGGKDSTVCAALLVKALGADRVIGVLMPNGTQKDVADSYKVCEILGITPHLINIKSAFDGIITELFGDGIIGEDIPDMILTNLPSRLRMSVLYSVAAANPNSRVCCTSNRSEIYLGYCTKGGDTVGDFAPLASLLVRNVYKVGDDLGLPYELVHKTPDDGMSGKSDEEKMGVPYEVTDRYLAGELTPDNKSSEYVYKIEKMHESGMHKFLTIPSPSYLKESIGNEPL